MITDFSEMLPFSPWLAKEFMQVAKEEEKKRSLLLSILIPFFTIGCYLITR
jgi:hypothetical protein